MIIDDHYVATGSANHNSRSLTIDSELQIAIVERQTLTGSIGTVPT
jgi:phosphatidylserine/phosphatidylglycerophosphate/cardiolipin synthase-like enzyme